jgi:hypothetical protein
VGIGGDQIIGLSYVDLLGMFEKDPGTEAIIMIGEIGGTAEQEAAEYIREGVRNPVVAFIARLKAPGGQKNGPCGSDHCRRQGDGKGEDGGPRKSRCSSHQESDPSGRRGYCPSPQSINLVYDYHLNYLFELWFKR